MAAYAYLRLAHSSTVHHFGRWGETVDSIETYLFSATLIQIAIAIVVTIKWLRWSPDQERLAARERRDRATNPRIRPLNLDILYRIFCFGVVVAEMILLGLLVYRVAMTTTNGS